MATEIQNDQELAAFDAIAENVYIVDAKDYHVLYINESGRNRLGLEGDGYKGEPCYRVLRNKEEPCPDCQVATCRDVRRWESYNPKLDLNYLVTESSCVYKGRDARLQLCMDISEQVRQRDALQLTLQAEAVLNETVHILYAEMDINEAAPKMLEHIGLYMRGERSFIFDIHGKTMSNTYAWSRPKASPVKDALQNIGTECVERWLDTFSRQMSVIIMDAELVKETHPAEYEFLQRMNVKNCVIAPIIVGGSLIGFFGIANLPSGRMEGASTMMMTLSYFLANSLVLHQNRQMMEKASYVDVMTGVANRNAFIRDIEKGQAELARDPKPVGVFYFDLNVLKETNDSQGHRAGDRLITRLADLISLFFRKHEIYRTGGDEFVVIVHGEKVPLCRYFIKQFNAEMSRKNANDSLEPWEKVSAAVGVAFYDSNRDKSADEVFKRADHAMYQNKIEMKAQRTD